MFHLSHFFLSLSVLASSTVAASSSVSGTEVEKVFLNSKEMILLTIDKTSMTANLATLEEPGAPTRHIRSFEIAIGKAWGDKKVEGDNKTPEGIYFTQKHIDEGTLLQSKYGPHAIPLDFPNSYDRLEGKTGYGIWLHGAGDDARIAKKSVTEGCVAFYNSDITALKSWLPAYQAVVVIAKDQSKVNVKADIMSVEAATKKWYQSWKNKNINGYINSYDPSFSYKRLKNLSDYKQYKKRVFASYKNMNVKVNDIRVITHPKYAVSIMNQNFNGDNRYVSVGRKVLFWEKGSNGEWRIIREKFEKRRFSPTLFSGDKLQQIAKSGISREENDKG